MKEKDEALTRRLNYQDNVIVKVTHVKERTDEALRAKERILGLINKEFGN